MADRTDIDALLISALYGELTPADDARLTAHLESHPADRTVLADLTRTRATVRESRILAVQFEPSQSVCARLLQEAARRVPRPEREAAGWFHRFMRSFMAHPAMAAAAMLVLIVGIAGTVYVRRGDQFLETGASAPAPASDRASLSPADQPSSIAAAPAQVAAEGAPGGDNKNQESDSAIDLGGRSPTPTLTPAAGSDAYRVRLDELAAKQDVARDELPAPARRAKGSVTVDGQSDLPSKELTRQEKQRSSEALSKFGGSDPRPVPPPSPPRKAAGIELRSPELQPKDFENDKKDSSKREFAHGRGDVEAGNRISNEQVAQAPGASAPAGPAGGGAASAPAVVPQRPPPAPASAPAQAPAPPRAVVARNDPSNGLADGAKMKAPAKTLSRPSPAQGQVAAASPPATGEGPTAERDNRRQADKPAARPPQAKPAEPKANDDKPLLGWARTQHDRVVALVKANNCRVAATTAIEIYNRAPDYYAANVATDRSVKPCLFYLNTERQREDRSRAAKRANAADAADMPAAESAPPVRK